MDLYTKIKNLLTSNPECRNSYKELRWRIWEDEGTVVGNVMSKSQFFQATDAETIRRTAQKVVEENPELGSTGDIRRKRQEREKLGGHFVWNNQKPKFTKEHIEGVLSVLNKKYENPSDRTGEEWEKDKLIGIKYRKMLDDLNNEFAISLFGT